MNNLEQKRDPTGEERLLINRAWAAIMDDAWIGCKERAFVRQKKTPQPAALSWLSEVAGSGHPALDAEGEREFSENFQSWANPQPFKCFGGWPFDAGAPRWFATEREAAAFCDWQFAQNRGADEPVVVGS